jgi:hypothetical protein
MSHRIRTVIAIALVLILFLVGIYTMINRWFEYSVIKPYNVFRAQEVEAISQFDQLNKGIADDLPPLPSGVQFEKEYSVGINGPLYLHGRYLYLDLKKPTTISEDIFDYYRTYFLANGWSETMNGNTPLSYVYSRDTSCVEISVYSPDINNEYQPIQIEIWHDFRNQSFSPKVPEIPSGLFSLLESGKTFFVECPLPSR